MQTELFAKLQEDARRIIERESDLSALLGPYFLEKKNFSEIMCAVLSNILQSDFVTASLAQNIVSNAILANPGILKSSAKDLEAVIERDAAVTCYVMAIVTLKGFQAIQLHRIANYYWSRGEKAKALLIQSANSRKLAVDIHPACKMGDGIMFDHATGIVIGETCVIEDDVSIMQSVTLGGTGKESGDRHPKIGKGVMIGSGARVLGNIKVGTGAKIGAGSVVLSDVAAHTTVVGVPAKVIGKPKEQFPAETMNQNVLQDEN